MAERPLGRVLDPDALSASDGPRGKVRVEVPQAWLGPGAEVDITLPARVVCARCDGGGCDGCARSGALRTPDDARTLRVPLPAELGDGAAVRLVQPFGDGGPIEQLIVELRPAAVASPGVARAPRPAVLTRYKPASVLAVGVGLATAVVAALLTRGC